MTITIGTVNDRARARECVARGVAWLDEVAPEWRGRVPEGEIQMESPSFCVCGWVFAADAALGELRDQYDEAPSCGYDYACLLLSAEVGEPERAYSTASIARSAELGFTVGPRGYESEPSEVYALLGETWRAELAESVSPAPRVPAFA